MKRTFSIAIGIALCIAALPAGAQNIFTRFIYEPQHNYDVQCAVHLECTVNLLPGEKVTNATIGNFNAFHPRINYIGGDANAPLTPQIALRADSAGLSTNLVIDTSQGRTYYFLARSVEAGLKYYTFATPAPRDTGLHISYAPAAVVTPPPDLGGADLANICTDGNYSVDVQPAEWRPQRVCDDGRHTFLQLAQLAQARQNVPILHSVTDGEQALVNYTYDARTSRYVVDGVFPELALVGGTAAHPFTLRVIHEASNAQATPDPTPTPIVTPAAVRGPNGITIYTPPPAAALHAPIATTRSSSFAQTATNPQEFAATPTPSPAPAGPAGPVPIYDASGTLVAYTDANLVAHKNFVPVLDANGNVTGYRMAIFTHPGTSNDLTTPQLIQPPKSNCPQPSATGLADSGWDSHTQWSRNLRYVTQGADAFVTASAISHGAVSKGLFGFIKSPIAFLVGQALEDYLADRATAHACPRVQNMVNTGLGLSAVLNALRTGAHP